MTTPVWMLFGGFSALAWLGLAWGVFEDLKTGVSPAQGRFREVRRDQEPGWFWSRVAANCFGLLILSILLVGAIQSGMMSK
ncbi:MAG: hypothetical protein ACKOPM_04535 [Novosphingobium sp.]